MPDTFKSPAAGFSGADANHIGQIADEDLAVADLAGLGAFANRVEDRLQDGIIDDDLDLDLGNEIDGILGAAVHFGVAFLAAEAADLGDGHALDPRVGQCLFDVVELEMADNGFNFLHVSFSLSVLC